MAAHNWFTFSSGLQARSHTSSLFYHSLTFSLSWRLRFAGSQDGPHAQEQLPTAQPKPSPLGRQFQPGTSKVRFLSCTAPTYSSHRPVFPGGHQPKFTGASGPHSQPSHPSQIPRGSSPLLIGFCKRSASSRHLPPPMPFASRLWVHPNLSPWLAPRPSSQQQLLKLPPPWV